MKKLDGRNDSIILRPDKGNGVALLNKLMYDNIKNLILSDNKSFNIHVLMKVIGNWLIN